MEKSSLSKMRKWSDAVELPINCSEVSSPVTNQFTILDLWSDFYIIKLIKIIDSCILNNVFRTKIFHSPYGAVIASFTIEQRL